MPVDLKPCPYCGSTNLKLFGESAPEWWVACKDCEAASRCHSQKHEAIAAWNRRSPALSAIAADRNRRSPDPFTATSDSDAKAILEIWDAAKAEAAMYVSAHCVDGEMHADVIMSSKRPKIRTIAAPVSAGLSDDDIRNAAYDVALIDVHGNVFHPVTLERIHKFARALSARLLPEGWVAVPLNMTDDMVDQVMRNVGPPDDEYHRLRLRALYVWMIAAAPTEVQAEPRQEG